MPEHEILKEGRNCWRIAHADRVAFLVDGAAYFAAFVAALEKARQSVFIIGWDIDRRIRLLRDDQPRDLPTHLESFLAAILKRRPGLRAYVLAWDFAMIYALERDLLPLFRGNWTPHRRLQFRYDSSHPAGASHHQKIVVADDQIAFVGGFDLAQRRWDTPEHVAFDPRRIDPKGSAYAPFHDVQMAVEGEAAAALGELARQRWLRATGRKIKPPVAAFRPEGSDLPADLTDVRVGIARTEPGYENRPEIREVERLYLDSIAAARSSIYIENQFFTSPVVSAALARRLEEPQGPDVVIVLPQKCSGWLEETTIGLLRGRHLKRLQAADRYGRLRVYFPMVPGLGFEHLNVHAKVLVVDDCLVRVGSSNVTNRSLGFDTECDLAVESCGESRVEKGIQEFRNRLLAEHLGATPSQVREVLASRRSLIAAIDALRGSPRTLQPLVVEDTELLEVFAPDDTIVDPERPVSAEELVKEFRYEDVRASARDPVLRAVVFLSILAVLVGAWQWTPLGAGFRPGAFVAWVQALRGDPMAAPFALAAYVLGSMLLVPITFLIVLTALTFGPWMGLLYSMAGSLLSGVVTFEIGRRVGRETVRRWVGTRITRLSRRVKRRGLLAVATVRLVPVAPFGIVNLFLGASRIRMRNFIGGTLVGLGPGILVLSLFTAALEHAVRNPSVATISIPAGMVLLTGVGIHAVRRRLARHGRAVGESPTSGGFDGPATPHEQAK